MFDKNLKNFLIGMVSNVVRDIKENVFKVRVENQIKFPEEMKVSNQKDIQKVSGEIKVKDLDKAIESLEKIEKKEIKFPKQLEEIKIKDLDKLINKKDVVIPDEFTIKNIDSVVKVLEDIKSKKYPEQKEIKFPNSFEISNLKDIPIVENMKVHKLDDLIKSIKNIGSLNRDEKNPIPVRLSDGKYFYKALDKVVDKVISTGGVNNVGVRNASDERFNPATEEKQDDIITNLPQDDLVNANVIIKTAHHEIHEGRSFQFGGEVVLASAATRDYLIITPNTTRWAHITFIVRSSGESNYCLYEDTTVSSAGTLQTVFNHNRNSVNTNTTLAYLTPTVTGIGTCIHEEHLGSGQKTGGEARGVDEIILKQNTVYLLRITSEAAANDVSWIVNWYEHQNK